MHSVMAVVLFLTDLALMTATDMLVIANMSVMVVVLFLTDLALMTATDMLVIANMSML